MAKSKDNAAQPPASQLLTAKDVAERLSVSRRCAYDLIKFEMATVRIGRLVRVRETELERFIAANSTESERATWKAWQAEKTHRDARSRRGTQKSTSNAWRIIEPRTKPRRTGTVRSSKPIVPRTKPKN